MNTNKFVQHPGEILRKELECRKITGLDFSNIIGKSPSEVSELLNGKRNITASWSVLSHRSCFGYLFGILVVITEKLGFIYL